MSTLEKQEWILKELQKIYDTSDDYYLVTIAKATQDIIREQQKRIEQMEGEIDGTLWSPKRWGE
ncbi:MAG: hypothetical protein FWJ66_02720 [Caldibacillus sp.]